MKDTTLKTYYAAQKCSAKKRNIDWEFDFQSWLDWWGDDIIYRGRRKDDLCMCRFEDKGPYSPDNVYKATKSQNNKDQAKWITTETRQKMSKSQKGILKTYAHKRKIALGNIGKNNKRIQTPGGIFESRKAAAEFYNVAPDAISTMVRKQPKEYYYIGK